MQSLTEILAAFTPKDYAYLAPIDSTWLQGRTVFGGLIAALANQAIRRRISADRPLRALQIVFVGPNAEGTVEFSPSVLREGKAVTLAACEIRSAGTLSGTMSAMYGAARHSMLAIRPRPVTVPTPPNEIANFELPPDIAGFTQHYDRRWARGDRPFSASTESPMSVYLRYRCETSATLTETHALALMDVIPSPALALLDKPSPASTLSWTLEILDARFDFGKEEWWRLDADVDAAADGYVVHTSHVVNPAGRVAAISRQVVVVYG